MTDINRAQCSGRLGKDAETRYTPNGQAVTQFTVASERRYKKDGEWTGETEWFRVTCWGPLGERAAEQLRKGQPVYVEGRLQTRSWEKDGVKRYTTELVADVVLPGVQSLKEGGQAARGQTTDASLDDLPF